MKIFTSCYKPDIKKFFILSIIFIHANCLLQAQNDSARIKRLMPDTGAASLNMDASYNRPFLQFGKIPVAIGGYAEVNTQYEVADGISEGFSFQMRRMSLFVASSIHQRIKFLSEIEFEDGAKEISLETAFIDLELHPLLNVRAGIILNPIGAFNQNHDGPRWEFVDRPLSATQMLPATWSNVGMGLHGKLFQKDWVFAYEAYLTNGFDDKIISNEENKTFLPASKENADRLEESSNGVPLFTGKIGIRNRRIGEIGFSYMGGVYNKFKEDGLIIDNKRRADVFAIDFNTTLPKINTYINAEAAVVYVDVPATYSQQFGEKQWGGFIDIVQPVLKKKIFGFEKSVINLAVRFEYVDWNAGTFIETGDNIEEDIMAVSPAVSWRPTGQTVLRFNYYYRWQQDLLGNPVSRTAGIQFGISTYF
ncbi:MAG TPA: hypothetical protein VJY62_18950 [Bacteroidia bacterium]|nr:hypothetical protein [Bacteroidia bacterium]